MYLDDRDRIVLGGFSAMVPIDFIVKPETVLRPTRGLFPHATVIGS